MRIKTLQLTKVGVFENELIEFKPCPSKDKAEIHIFTGTNGTGKSTLLKSMVAAFENVGINRKEEILCKADTNSFTRYLREKNSQCGSTLSIQSTEDFEIKYIGCPEGASHLHIISKDTEEISDYRSILDESKKVDQSSCFEFCLFAYSGNRFINISNDSPEKTTHIKNPIYGSLEFNKKPNSAFFIDKWLETSLLKESYAKREGLNKHSKNFNTILTKLESTIGEIVGFVVKIKMDKKTLREPGIFYDGVEHNIDVLPDGLKSILSWLLDLCMRLENLTWMNDIPIFDRNIILFLDEIEAHLHIEWQRKILPAIQKLFPNAQIFISTHSPFVVNSVDDAWVYNLEVEKGNAKVRKVELSQDGKSFTSVLRNIFGVKETFGPAIEKDLAKFKSLISKALDKSISGKEEKELAKIAQDLAQEGTELESIVGFELRQVEKLNKKEVVI